MTENERSYFLKRASEEELASQRSTCPEAIRVHRELARRYIERAGEPSAMLTETQQNVVRLGLA